MIGNKCKSTHFDSYWSWEEKGRQENPFEVSHIIHMQAETTSWLTICQVEHGLYLLNVLNYFANVSSTQWL